MSESGQRPSAQEVAQRREQAAPGIHHAWETLEREVFSAGTLSERTKQLIAVAVAHTTQCPYCIDGHTQLARGKGAGEAEVMEAIWVAATLRAGGAYAHSTRTFDVRMNGPAEDSS